MSEVRAHLGRIFLYSWLSYRALFSFLNPATYISSLVAVPGFTGLLLVVISQQTHSDPVRPAVGSAMLSSANAVLFGTTFATLNERHFGTLRLWLSTPQHLLEALIAKSAIHILNGLITGAITFVFVAGLTDTKVHATTVEPLLLCALTGGFAAGGLALLSVTVSLWTRDTLGLPNVLRALILVASGALIDPSALFIDLGWLTPLLPLSHAVKAALAVVNGRAILWGELGLEVAVGIAWATVGYFLFRVTLILARNRNLLELA